MGGNYDLSDFDYGMVVGALRSQQEAADLLGFHTQQNYQ